MTDKIWLTDTEVGTRFGSTRQWVWTQARNNPQFPRPVKITPRWSRWCLQEIEAFEQEATGSPWLVHQREGAAISARAVIMSASKASALAS